VGFGYRPPTVAAAGGGESSFALPGVTPSTNAGQLLDEPVGIAVRVGPATCARPCACATAYAASDPAVAHVYTPCGKSMRWWKVCSTVQRVFSNGKHSGTKKKKV